MPLESMTLPLLGELWGLKPEPDGELLVAIPRSESPNGAMSATPILTGVALPPQVARCWEAHRLAGEPVRMFDVLVPEGEAGHPILATHAEAELLAACMLARLPRVHEILAIAGACGETCRLEQVAEGVQAVWSADYDTPLRPTLAQLAPEHPDLDDRPSVLSELGCLRSDERRIVRFAADGSRSVDSRMPDERAAVWIVFDATMTASLASAGPGT